MFGNDRISKIAQASSDAITKLANAVDKQLKDVGKLISEVMQINDEKFVAITNVITQLEERVELLETALESALVKQTDNPFSNRSSKGMDIAHISQNKGLNIEYTSSNGQTTKRQVFPQQACIITLEGIGRHVTEFSGYCSLRQSHRTFITSGITEAFDAETGEEVDASGWILAKCKN